MIGSIVANTGADSDSSHAGEKGVIPIRIGVRLRCMDNYDNSDNHRFRRNPILSLADNRSFRQDKASAVAAQQN